MIGNILTVLIVCYVLFEVIEHVFFPLVWFLVARKRRSVCGNEGMLGKIVEVKSWQSGEGRVIVDGELWNAASGDILRPGDKALVKEINGLVLKIASQKEIQASCEIQ